MESGQNRRENEGIRGGSANNTWKPTTVDAF